MRDLFKKICCKDGRDDDIRIDVSESDGVRSLHLASHAIQSSMRIKKPFHLELTYTRAMMMFLLFHDRPRKILLIGLGGASIPKFIHRFLPDMKSIVVEIHQKVISVAHQMFHLPPNDNTLKVIHGDGIPYMNEHPQSTDILMIDAFDPEGIPRNFRSLSFFDLCKSTLRVNGIFVMNIWMSDPHYDLYIDRMRRVFEDLLLVIPTGKPGNQIVLGFHDMPNQLDVKTLKLKAKSLEKIYGLEFLAFFNQLMLHNHQPSHTLQFHR
jgi:spermidine synthase